jgi:dienelactone hydrolase
MSVVIACPACGQKHSAGADLAGKKIRCRGCGGGIHVPAKAVAKVPAAPKPPPPPDDDLDAYGLAEEPDAPDADDGEAVATVAKPRRKAAGGKARGGGGGFLATARERPIVAAVAGAAALGFLGFLAMAPSKALGLLTIAGLGSLLVGALAAVVVTFAQAPATAILLLCATFLSLSAAAQLAGAIRTNGFRFEMLGAAALAWGGFFGRMRHVEVARGAYRIPKALLGLGAAMLVPAIVLAAIFVPRVARNRPPGAPPASARFDPDAPPALPFDIDRPIDLGPAPLPDLPPGRPFAPGVTLHEVTFGPPWHVGAQPGHSGKLWVYLPAGDAPAKSLPCVLIAGAGSNLITGMDLSAGDQAEHVPWARAGFAVVAYEIDGAVPGGLSGNVPESLLKMSAGGFLKARAGVANAQHALDYVAAKLPQVDPSRILAVGHSSAGTLALLAAQSDPRIRAVVAFAPGRYETDPQMAAALRGSDREIPGISKVLTTFNPAAPENLSRLGGPAFLFTAEDDGNVPASATRELAAALQGRGKSVTLEVVPAGGHYDAMIDPGIPRAIAWAKALPAGR